MKANESNLNGKRLTVHLDQITLVKERYDTGHQIATYTVPFTYEGKMSEMDLRYDLIKNQEPDGIDLELEGAVEYSFFTDVPAKRSKRRIARLVIKHEGEIAQLIEKLGGLK